MKDGRLVQVEWDGVLRPRREVIRQLQDAGLSIAEISRRLGVRYQIVRSAVKRTARADEMGEAPVRPLSHPAGAPDPGPHDDHSHEGIAAILLGCVKTQGAAPSPAKDLYTSNLFRLRRQHAEESGLPWWIFSAKYGLVDPDQMIPERYNVLIARRPLHERQQIARALADQLDAALGGLAGKTLELHAGDEYFLAINPTVRQRGATIWRPLEGLGIGEQMAWYGNPRGRTLWNNTREARPEQRAARSAGVVRPPRTVPELPTGDARGLAQRISAAFMTGQLDLS